MAQTAAYLADRVIPPVPVQQWAGAIVKCVGPLILPHGPIVNVFGSRGLLHFEERHLGDHHLIGTVDRGGDQTTGMPSGFDVLAAAKR
jgi:hypothetical protein